MKRTSSSVVVRAPRGKREFSRLCDILFQSFAGFGREYRWTPAWLEQVGRANCRVAIRNGEIAAGLGILYFGQFFGGRRVSSAGITAVGVAAEARGAGVATEMMRTTVRQLHARGLALSVLYPSTYALYRKAGYEPAGARMHYKLNTATLGVRDHSLPLVSLGVKDIPAIRRCYEAHARFVNGRVDRTPREWKRMLTYGVDRIYACGVPSREKRGELDGYVVYTQTGALRGPMEVMVRDVAGRNIAAIRRLLTFFADHATMAEHVFLEGGPAMPLLAMAREEWVDVPHRVFWMVRMLDVAKALSQRGYSALLTTEVHFEIHDELLSNNDGRFVLEVKRGTGRVRSGGNGSIRLDIRGLSPLFTGHLSAEELETTGLLEGSPGDLANASAVFAGSAPWMNDRF